MGTTNADTPLRRSRWTKDLYSYLFCGFCEFIGTFFFLFCVFTAISAMQSVSPVKELDPIKVLFVGFSFGFSLLVNAWIFYRITGGLFNPALTWGMVIVGTMPLVKGVIMFCAQLIGGIVAAAGADAILPGKLNVSCRLVPGVSRGRGLMLECLLTAELMLAVLFLSVEKHRATPFAPLVIGFTIAIIHFIAVPFTGASINPARAFGPAVIEGTFDNKHWVFWIGPLMGTTFASLFYLLLKKLHYRDLNPTQDLTRDPELEDRETKRGNALMPMQNGYYGQASGMQAPGQAPIQRAAYPPGGMRDVGELEQGEGQQEYQGVGQGRGVFRPRGVSRDSGVSGAGGPETGIYN